MHLCYFFMSSWCLAAVARALLLYCKAAAASLYSALIVSFLQPPNATHSCCSTAHFSISATSSLLFSSLSAMYFYVLLVTRTYRQRAPDTYIRGKLLASLSLCDFSLQWCLALLFAGKRNMTLFAIAFRDILTNPQNENTFLLHCHVAEYCFLRYPMYSWSPKE